MKNRSNAVPNSVTQSLPLVRAVNLWTGGNLTGEESDLVRNVCLEFYKTGQKQSMVEFLAIAKLTKEHGFPSAKASAAVKKFFSR